MVDEKGLPPAVADRIGQFVVLRGRPRELLATLLDAGEPAVLRCAMCGGQLLTWWAAGGSCAALHDWAAGGSCAALT